MQQQQANEEVQAQRDKVREAKLRAAWEQLPEAERDAILVAVKVENPGLGRWKNMLEPLCLSELETRMKESERREQVNGCCFPRLNLFIEFSDFRCSAAELEPTLFVQARIVGFRFVTSKSFLLSSQCRAIGLTVDLRCFDVSTAAAVARVVKYHRGDDGSQQVVDDLGSVLPQVDGVKPEFLVQILLDGEHPLNPSRLGLLDPCNSWP